MSCVCGCPPHVDTGCDCGCSLFEMDNGTDVSITVTGGAYRNTVFEYDGRYGHLERAQTTRRYGGM